MALHDGRIARGDVYPVPGSIVPFSLYLVPLAGTDPGEVVAVD
jgi:hypothetical protein